VKHRGHGAHRDHRGGLGDATASAITGTTSVPSVSSVASVLLAEGESVSSPLLRDLYRRTKTCTQCRLGERTPTPMCVKDVLRMFERWPGEFIHAFMTEPAVD
jgi:hypothetical protein